MSTPTPSPAGAPSSPAGTTGGNLLLDPPALSPAEIVHLEGTLAEVLGTSLNIVLVPSEATLALEAAAVSLGRPGLRALNIVTGPYGRQFGRWLARVGCDVVDLEVPFDRAVSVEEVGEALRADPWDLVSVVHAEAATGVVNPLEAICGLARAAGALVVVDAVASVGADRIDIDGWGIDVCALGAQKAWAGPFGISALTVSRRAWAATVSRPDPVRQSSLSLLDWKEGWIDGPRAAIPLYLPLLETRALQAALDRIRAEGPEAVIDRHRRAARATRAGIEGLGLRPWVASTRDAAAVATLVHTPGGVSPRALAAASVAAVPAPVEAAPGGLGDQALRVTHTGRRATLEDVRAALGALSAGLRSQGDIVDPATTAGLEGALHAAEGAWHRAV